MVRLYKYPPSYRVETSHSWQDHFRWLPEHADLSLKRAREIKAEIVNIYRREKQNVKVRIIKTSQKVIN
jgi:hypothetical protein